LREIWLLQAAVSLTSGRYFRESADCMIDREAKERAEGLASLLDVALGFEAIGRRAIRAACSDGLLQGELRILLALLKQPLSQAQLARELRLDTGQITVTVKRLQLR
jgi:hypothetical protein